MNGRRKADVARNAKCHSDRFNGREVFSTGGRELKEAQVPYNPVDVSSLPLGIVGRRLLDSTSNTFIPTLFQRELHTLSVCILYS